MEILFLTLLFVISTIAFFIGKAIGIDEGINKAQDIAIQQDIQEERDTAKFVNDVLRIIDRIVSLDPSSRNRIITELYKHLDLK